MNCFTVGRKQLRFCLLLSADTICKRTITFAGNSYWAGTGPLKGFYVNGEILFSAVHLHEKSFWMMYSNLGLSFRWTLPLIIFFLILFKLDIIDITFLEEFLLVFATAGGNPPPFLEAHFLVKFCERRGDYTN